MEARLPLVLLPGLDGTGRLFGPLLRAVEERRIAHVVSYSPRAVVGYAGLLPALSRARPARGPWAVVAESFSGPLALRLARLRPAGLVAVVLVASFVRSPRRVPAWAAALAGPPVLSLPPSRRLVRRYLAGDDAAPVLVDQVVGAIRSVRATVLAWRLREVLVLDAADDLRRCPVPVLFVAGRSDRLVPDASVDALVQVRPDLAIERLQAPHLVLQRRPASALALIDGFLSGLTAELRE
jgi:hypothetical protein